MTPEPAREAGSLPPIRRWFLLPLLGLLLAGIGICVYLTRFHDLAAAGDATATLSNCPQTETTNCEVVNTSAYSELLGVPISALGIPTYLLLLILVVRGWRAPRHLGPVFVIGLLTVLYSIYLYYVSTVKIGYLCAWCWRLYLVNASIPVLSLVASGRSPVALARDAWGEPSHRFGLLWRITAVFTGLLILTVAGERAYRALLAGSPPRGSESTAAAPSRPADAASADAPFRAASPLTEFSGQAKSLQLKPFDLNPILGRGKPVALIFWQPGDRSSERGLVTLARFLRTQISEIRVFAVVGGNPEQRPEILWEAYCLLDVPADLPLLRDESFGLFKQLALTGFPSLVLFDGRGVRVGAPIQGLGQLAAGTPGRARTGEAIIRDVALGASPGTSPGMLPYFPGNELVGHCAPSFELPDLFTGKNRTFDPRSENGKPTLLMFWSATCKHCQKEIPQLSRYVKAHPGQLNLVSVAMIRSGGAGGIDHRRVTEAYVRSEELPWPVLDDSSGFAADRYRVVSTPTTFLMAPGGEIRGAWYYPHQNLETAMAAELPKLAASDGECTPLPPEWPIRASFSVAAPDGREVGLDQLTDRPTVLHFWATWCAPCQAELPKLLRFREALEREGGRLVLVSVEDSGASDRVMKYGSRLASGFTSFLAPRGGLADRLDLSYSVPRTYLLAHGGEVLRTFRGALPWEDPSFEKTVLTTLQLPARRGS